MRNEEQRPLPHPNRVKQQPDPVPGAPVDVWDQVNKYGTYEVQDTTDTDNTFPTIGPAGGWRGCLDAADKEAKEKGRT